MVTRPWGSRRENGSPRDKVQDKYYKSPLWRIQRKAFLREEPACRVCRIYDGIPRVAKVLDHFRPRRLWPELEDDQGNWCPMCDAHHAKKSGMETRCKSKEDWEKVVLPKFRLCDKQKEKI